MTANYDFHFPVLDVDEPNVPADLQQLAEDVDRVLKQLMTSAGLDGKALRSGYQVGTVNAQGRFAVTFPEPFAGAPDLMVGPGDTSSQVMAYAPVFSTITGTGFQVECRRADGSLQTSGSFRVVWFARGAVA